PLVVNGKSAQPAIVIQNFGNRGLVAHGTKFRSAIEVAHDRALVFIQIGKYFVFWYRACDGSAVILKQYSGNSHHITACSASILDFLNRVAYGACYTLFIERPLQLGARRQRTGKQSDRIVAALTVPR